MKSRNLFGVILAAVLLCATVTGRVAALEPADGAAAVSQDLWPDHMDVEFYDTLSRQYETDYLTPQTALTIQSAAQLAALAVFSNKSQTHNFTERYVRITQDINLAEYGWVPISAPVTRENGSDYASGGFAGFFDGGGYAIEGLRVAMGSFAGLFGALNKGTIENLTIDGTVSGNWNTGAIAGIGIESLISNCTNYAAVTSTGYCGGGIVGQTNGDIRDCVNYGVVMGDGNVGGISGWTGGKGSIIACGNHGAVSGANRVGGISGRLASATANILFCCNTATISASASNPGGIVGVCDAGHIQSCFSTVQTLLPVGYNQGVVESVYYHSIFSEDVTWRTYQEYGTNRDAVGIEALVLALNERPITATVPRILYPYTFRYDSATELPALVPPDPIQYTSDVTLIGPNAVRYGETNLGDLCTDAMLYAARAEGQTPVAAIITAGMIRTGMNPGPISPGELMTIFPFGGALCTLTVSGAELLQTLEDATADLPRATPKLPQVSGMEYTVDWAKPYQSGTVSRVAINTVGDEPFDPEKLYTIATIRFLAGGGDGYTAFASAYAQNGNDLGMMLDCVVASYLRDKLNGSIGAQYAAPQGRITLMSSKKFCVQVDGADTEAGITTLSGQLFAPGSMQKEVSVLCAVYAPSGRMQLLQVQQIQLSAVWLTAYPVRFQFPASAGATVKIFVLAQSGLQPLSYETELLTR